MIFQKKLQFIFIILFIFTLFMIFNCEDNGTNNLNDVKGQLVIKITDAPFPISQVTEANVTIHKIEIKNENEDDGSPFITVSTDTNTINLIELRNGITEQLAELELPEGKYNQVRLYVLDAKILLTDGQEFDLKIPSGSQSGIKIIINPSIEIEEGITAELLLDFDLNKSFVVQGNPNSPSGIKGFNFKPVIRAVNNTLSGSIFGNVKDTTNSSLYNAQVWVEQDSIISSTFTDEEGRYELIGLPIGTYDIFATMDGYDTKKVADINIEVGDRLRTDFVLTPSN